MAISAVSTSFKYMKPVPNAYAKAANILYSKYLRRFGLIMLLTVWCPVMSS